MGFHNEEQTLIARPTYFTVEAEADIALTCEGDGWMSVGAAKTWAAAAGAGFGIPNFFIDGAVPEIGFSVGSGAGRQQVLLHDTDGLHLDGKKIGFFGEAPIAKPTVVGVKADAVAGALVAALDSLGLILDSTT